MCRQVGTHLDLKTLNTDSNTQIINTIESHKRRSAISENVLHMCMKITPVAPDDSLPHRVGDRFRTQQPSARNSGPLRQQQQEALVC